LSTNGRVAAGGGVAGWLRHQLPVYSPLPFGATLPALAVWARPAADPRPALLASLLADYDADAGVLCGSGTQALRLALDLVLRQADGMRVALPAFSCYDVAAAAVATGAEVLLYDVDPATLAPDVDSLERVLRRGARVVVAAPLYGVPLDWESVRSRCEAHGAALVEDAAQGFGAAWRGRPLGSLGDISVLSFGRGKGWTGGRGGALLLRGAAAGRLDLPAYGAVMARDEISTAATSAVQATLGRPSLYRIPVSLPWLRLGETVYHDAAPPTPMPRTAAEILRRTRALADRESGARRHHARTLLGAIRYGAEVQTVAVEPGAEPGFLRLPLRVAQGMHGFRDPHSARRLGIAPGYPAPLSELPALRPLLVESVAYPGAAELAHTLITLPTHSCLRAGEREQVLRLVNTYGGKA
jgi:perosamine synthetase